MCFPGRSLPGQTVGREHTAFVFSLGVGVPCSFLNVLPGIGRTPAHDWRKCKRGKSSGPPPSPPELAFPFGSPCRQRPSSGIQTELVTSLLKGLLLF